VLTLSRSLFRHRRLVRDFVARDLKARYVGSSMGFFWSVVFPVVMLFVYMFVFRLLFKVRWGDEHGPKQTGLIMLCGILVWVAFSETLSRATNCLVENANLIQKVVFPSEVLPAFLGISSLVNMLIGLPIVVLGVLAWTDNPIGPSMVMIPALIALQMLFTLGLAYFLAVMNLYLRDTFHVIGVALNVWMFATPIFYSDKMVREARILPTETFEGHSVEFLLWINPMHWLIDSWRQVLVFGKWPDPMHLYGLLLVGVAVFALGSLFFQAQKPRIPDLL
jgi:ABC-type polysaccharide/polyol phosphate export permease